MTCLNRVRRGVASPNLILRKLNKLYFSQFGAQTYNASGIDVFDRDWDNLVILDACRYDLFEHRSDLNGNLERVISKGASTTEFLDGNFAGRNHRDVVYVTANPQYYRHREVINCELHDVMNVWLEDGWNDEYGTVLPEAVEASAMKAAEEYGNKRLVIHYMQPHYPFVNADTTFDKGQLENPDDDAAFWRQIMTGKISVDTDRLWALYEHNLDIVLDSVDRLINSLDGKVVITSDHGNMLGERSAPIPIREWGHPRGIHTPQLVEVPWLEIEGERREITAEDPKNPNRPDTDTSVKQRLRDLGYT